MTAPENVGWFGRHVTAALRHPFAAATTIGVGAIGALGWSALGDGSYRRLITGSFSTWLTHQLDLGSVRALATNGVLTLFFFAVGMELSREIRFGELRHLRHGAAGLTAALGGMGFAAGAFALFGELTGNHSIVRGWGVPMATDVAFTLASLSIAGTTPPSLRRFLLTLAVADDALSVMVLILLRHHDARPWWLLASLVPLAVLFVRPPAKARWWLVGLVVTWAAWLIARVEPSLAGVFVGLCVPFTRPNHDALEQRTQEWSNGLALPLFAVVACGVAWSSLHWTTTTGELFGAILVARLIGKTTGVASAGRLTRRLDQTTLAGVTNRALVPAGMLCAIGITVPLLFAGAVYGFGSSDYQMVTVALVVASGLGAIGGVVGLRRFGGPSPT